MRLPKVNAIITHKRRTVTSGNKKEDTTLQTLIPAFISDTGTTSDHEQTYVIMIDVDDVTATINPDTDTLVDASSVKYKVMNSVKKTYHYSLRCIKSI
jgi:hypothetical protein